jgi:hypothetical protein
MRKLLLALGLLVFMPLAAQAQCIGVGGVNNVPVPGIVCAQDGTVPTYFVNSIGIVPAATPTDIFCLTGSATKTVRVKQVRVTGTAGTAINITTYLMKHSVANTGGTAASTEATGLPTLTAADSTFATVTATATAYTGNPTIDSTRVFLSSQTHFLPVTSTAVAAPPALWLFDPPSSFSPLVLRGVAQQLCVNYNGVTTPSSGVVAVSAIFTEQ